MNTPRYKHKPIAMALKDYTSDFHRCGHFCWSFDAEGQRTLILAIPVRRGGQWNENQWLATEWTIDHKNHCDAQWSWDGNETAPTLTPSLHAVGVWHGYVRRGQLVEAG